MTGDRTRVKTTANCYAQRHTRVFCSNGERKNSGLDRGSVALSILYAASKMGRRGGGCKKRSTQEKLAENAQPNRVVLFHSHAPGKKYREFSNFFMHQQPYMFILPDFATQGSLPTQVECEFSEKAIMATKAALMNDPETFAQIVESRDPKTCKELGRRVHNWEQDLWDKHIEEIAFEVVSQKFESEKGRKPRQATGFRLSLNRSALL